MMHGRIVYPANDETDELINSVQQCLDVYMNDGYQALYNTYFFYSRKTLLSRKTKRRISDLNHPDRNNERIPVYCGQGIF